MCKIPKVFVESACVTLSGGLLEIGGLFLGEQLSVSVEEFISYAV